MCLNLMVTILNIWVPGVPRPKGSLKVRKNRSVEESPKTKLWCRCVVDAANRSPDQHYWPATGPVKVDLTFYLDTPITNPPDLDKLARAILDSISRGTSWGAPVIKDDALVVKLYVEKKDAGETHAPGVTIVVRSL